MSYLWVALGGALGAVSRYTLASWLTNLSDKAFPYGTLSVNLIGSFAIGIVYVLFVVNQSSESAMRFLLMVGFLGAFTTFSTFSLESLHLLQDGRLMAFFTYVGASLTGCLLATALGIWITKSLT